MIPIPLDEYFDDEVICVEGCCFIVEEDGYETEGEPAWSSYYGMEVETQVCY